MIKWSSFFSDRPKPGKKLWSPHVVVMLSSHLLLQSGVELRNAIKLTPAQRFTANV